MACAFFTRLNLSNVLKIIYIIEMAYWVIIIAITLLVFYTIKNDDSILKDLQSKQKEGESKEQPFIIYRKMIHDLETTKDWGVGTAVILFFLQFLLMFGIRRKNRCMMFSWILFSIIVAIPRVCIILLYSTHLYLRLLCLLWAFRLFFFYLGARFMLQITNERLGAEEVEPPQFRPQSDDPRENREGLNYPSHSRSLEFAHRMAGMNKKEHAHPKRWEPTYDAIDSEGRMIVVVDDPIYEHL